MPNEQHPSYGMIGVHHVTGAANLVGSDFHHHNFVSLQIHRGQRHRDLSRDWWSTRDELIEVWLTEAQFVEMVGRPNMGSGIPCTIHRVAGESQPDPPPPEKRKTQGHADLRETAKKAQDAMREMLAVIEVGITDGKIGKKRLEQMAFSLRCQVENFAPNMEFVMNSFDEAMDETINRAGVEIEATIAQVAMRLGIDEMKRIGAQGPRLIGDAPEGREVL